MSQKSTIYFESEAKLILLAKKFQKSSFFPTNNKVIQNLLCNYIIINKYKVCFQMNDVKNTNRQK